MVLDTSLPEGLQEELEQKIVDVLAGVSESEHRVERHIPEPRRSGDLDLDLAPELTSIALKGFGDCLIVAELEFYLPVAPEVDIRPNDTRLAELDGGYRKLDEALVETLARYCDAAEETVEDEEDVDGAAEPEGFVCTEVFAGDTAKFSASVEYPPHVRRIYGEGLWEEARKFGLPI